MAAADHDFLGSKSALALFAVGGIASLFTLAGWPTGSLALKGFGIADYPAW
ncbi:MAG: hypothetical protein JF564_08090, partial [Sphingomonas sp.]|nr:hypothetical protein [Sphingomonas sp.]